MASKSRLVGTVVPDDEPPPTWTVTLYVLMPRRGVMDDIEPIVTTDALYAQATHLGSNRYDLYKQEMEIRR